MINKNEDKNSKILIVDDEENILYSLKRVLNSLKIDVFVARSGTECKDILSVEEIDILISDFRMPDMDGMQLMQSIKKEYPEIIRIIFSGFIDKEILLRAINAGWASIFVTKPWDNKTMNESITKLLYTKSQLKKLNLLEKINSIKALPTTNANVIRLSEMIKQKKTHIDLLEIVKSDPAISLSLFRAANCLNYEEKSITNLENALSLISSSSLMDIIINMETVEQLSWRDEMVKVLNETFFLSSLIDHYLAEFYIAKMNRKPVKYFHNLGLLCLIGRIVSLLIFGNRAIEETSDYICSPDKYVNNLKTGNSKKKISIFVIARCLMQLWNLPEIMIDSVIYLENPEKAHIRNLGIIHLLKEVYHLVIYLWENRYSEKLDLSKITFGDITKDKLKEVLTRLYCDIKTYTDKH